MKKLFLLPILVSTIFFSLTGCREEELGPDQGITISGIPETITLTAGESTGKLKIEVFSKDGIISFKTSINGAEVWPPYTFSGRTSFETTFEHSASVLEVGRPILVEFEAMDVDGDVVKHKLTLHVLDEPNTVRISADIGTDQVWETGKSYILTKKISVLTGATLTIQRGVIVKADYKEEDETPSLVILRGAKIHAEGSPDQPIVFTSILDNRSFNLSNRYQVWEIGRRNAWVQFGDGPGFGGDVATGFWGGLVIFGKATGSFEGNVPERSLEDNPYSDPDWKYGGLDDGDNSGFLKYVSIRYAGNTGTDNKPISSLTLGAVGTGTVIENLEVIMGFSGGIRILGGNVALKNILVLGAKGDGIAIDQGWHGALDNFFVGNSGNGISFAGPKGDPNHGNHTVKNGDLAFNQTLMKFEERANSHLSNLFFNIGNAAFDSPPPNVVSGQFSPNVSNLEALITGEFDLSDYFLEWEREVKVVNDYHLKSVGVDWTPFENWSLGYY